VSDDFRLRVTMRHPREAEQLGELLERGDPALGEAAGVHDRIAVSVDDREVFLYADTRERADGAAATIRTLAEREGWPVEIELRRWHPTAEEWEDPDSPLPDSDAARAAEHDELIARERAESEQWGQPEFEVRVECASHRATVELDERLRAEGLQSIRRWRFLLVGSTDEDSARALADRITAEAPPGSTVTVEATFATIARETPFNPFALFGGLGG
jgi:hypothetical protein